MRYIMQYLVANNLAYRKVRSGLSPWSSLVSMPTVMSLSHPEIFRPKATTFAQEWIRRENCLGVTAQKLLCSSCRVAPI